MVLRGPLFDHPLGVGMSFPFDVGEPQQRQIDATTATVSYGRGPDSSPVYLTGESYGGTYMPLLARRLLRTDPDVEIGGVVIVAEGQVVIRLMERRINKGG